MSSGGISEFVAWQNNMSPSREDVVVREPSGAALGAANTTSTLEHHDHDTSSLATRPSIKSSNQYQEALAEPELLALIVELRLRAEKRPNKDKSSTSSGSSKPTSSAVDTLDLSHLKIEKLPYEMVDIIKEDVVRLALGYNLINSLPSNFIDLSRLRYLNVRANLMNTFPSVLCTLPSLEILDISRNKIKKLPSEPGRLLDLRVLSISNNRLRKLPLWFHRMQDLRILKLEGNPISWPPPHISVMPQFDKATTSEADGEKIAEREAARKKAEDRHMVGWITKLKAWIEENKDRSKGDQEEARHEAISPEGKIQAIGEQPARDPILPMEPTLEPQKSQAGTSEPQTPGDGKRSIGATFLSIQNDAISEDERDQLDEVIAMPAKASPGARATEPAGEEVVISEPEEHTHADAGGTWKQVPKQQFIEEGNQEDAMVRSSSIASSLALQQVIRSAKNEADEVSRPPVLPLHHGRNNSCSTMQASSSLLAIGTGGSTTSLRRSIVQNKKSLPDLRRNQDLAVSDRSEGADVGPSMPSEVILRRKGQGGDVARRPPLPQTSSEGATSTINTRGITGEVWPGNATDAFENGAPSSRENKAAASIALSQMTPLEAAAVEVERNSYFRRLSTLPASTISKSISVPILECVDATRSVLYALSQMHSALKQYITFASDERMTSQLSRALDIASQSMAGLINSLDRFDSLSRIKGDALSPIIVRGVLTSCSESVVTFRKIISLLHLQLKSLQSSADIRYTRTLLLLLYGSLAEIHHSWVVMEPLFKDVLPYLQGQAEAASTPSSANTPVPSLSVGHPYTLPSIAEASSPISPENARFGMAPSRPLRRRHAGSFSAQDVVQGASMVPPVPLPTVGSEEIRKPQRPAALGPFPASCRSGMYQIQQGDLDGADLLVSTQLTPMEPPTPRDRIRRSPDDGSRRTLSNTSAGNTSAKSHVARSHSPYSNGAPIAVVDDHLVMLLVKITSIAYSVWASINDHLTSLGIPAAGRSTFTTNDRYTTPEHTPLLNVNNGFPISPHTPSVTLRMEESSSSVTVMDENLSPGTLSLSLPPQTVQLSSTILAKLRNLRDATQRIVEQTKKLELCCDKVQEKSGIRSPAMNSSSSTANLTADQMFKDIFVESSSFIKSILHISHFIKSLSNDHQFPKSIKVNLAQLTTCARDLTLHLHFLGASTSQAAPASTILSPKQPSVVKV